MVIKTEGKRLQMVVSEGEGEEKDDHGGINR